MQKPEIRNMPGHLATNSSSDSNSMFNCMVANSAVKAADEIKENAILYTVGYKLSGSFYWHEGDSDTSTSEENHGTYSDWGWDREYTSNHDTKTSATDFLKEHIATTASGNKQYAYTTNDASGLETEFKNLAAQIGAYYSVNPEKITDIIDARFKITEAGIKALVGEHPEVTETADGRKTYVKNTVKDGKVVGTVKITENSDGTTTVEWTGTEAHIGNVDNPDDPAWSGTIKVVAKDDFIGGNAITTNTGDSGIKVDESTWTPFPKPTVNVKALSLNITGKEITVYKGDEIQPLAYYQQLAQTINISELVVDKNGVAVKTLTGVKPTKNNGSQVSLPTLTAAQIKSLNKNGTLTIGDQQEYKYIYPNTSDAVGYFKYTYSIPKTPEDGNENLNQGNAGTHKAGDAASPAETYRLTVEFVPYTVEERKAATPSITVPDSKTGGTVVTSENSKLKESADYIVNIIDGSIEIVKVLETEPKNPTGDTFTFTVTGPDGFNKTVSLTVARTLVDGKYIATYNGDDLKHLARGEYTVIENDTSGYTVKSIENDDKVTNTKYLLNSPENIKFTLGTIVEDSKDVNVIKNYTYNPEDGGTLGKVIFTNEEVYADWDIVKVSASSHDLKLGNAVFKIEHTEDDSKVYYGCSDSNGNVQWYQDEALSSAVTNNKLAGGTYTLREIKAPAGYTMTTDVYTLIITSNGSLKSISKGDTVLTPEYHSGKYQILVENEAIYNLPSTGGIGIYWYMVGGILLMLVAALMYIKKWSKGVPGK